MRLLSCLLLVLATTACTQDSMSTPVSEEDRLSELGVFGVGFRREELTYTAPESSEPRVIEVAAWYPTAARGDANVRYSFRASGVALLDAEPEEGPFPTVVFSHGNQALNDVSSFLMEHLASHGWLVLAPNHTGNTSRDRLRGDRPTSLLYLPAKDVSHVLDHYSSDLQALVGETVIVLGHSFGGYNTFSLAGATYSIDALIEACAAGTARDDYCAELTPEAIAIFREGLRDSRIDAIVAMAGGNADLFSPDGIGDIEIPVLQMVAEEDGHPAGSQDENAYWPNLRATPRTYINFLTGGHNNFTDACLSPLPLRCGMDVDAEEMQRLVKFFTLAFMQDRLPENVDNLSPLESYMPPAWVEIYRSAAMGP